MADLKAFSLFDEQRALISNEIALGAKIMTYSALKLAIINSDLKFQKKESFLSAFTELKVVDRALNPDYVLQTCPNLKKLIIDWQEELSQAPFQNYNRLWFHEMIVTPSAVVYTFSCLGAMEWNPIYGWKRILEIMNVCHLKSSHDLKNSLKLTYQYLYL